MFNRTLSRIASPFRSKYQPLRDEVGKNLGMGVAPSALRQTHVSSGAYKGSISSFSSARTYGEPKRRDSQGSQEPLLKEDLNTPSELASYQEHSRVSDDCKLAYPVSHFTHSGNKKLDRNEKVDRPFKIKTFFKSVGGWIKKHPHITAAIAFAAVTAIGAATAGVGFAVFGGALAPVILGIVLGAIGVDGLMITGISGRLAKNYAARVNYLKENGISEEDAKWGASMSHLRNRTILNGLLAIKNVQELDQWPQDKKLVWETKADFEAAWRKIKNLWSEDFYRSPHGPKFVGLYQAFAKEMCNDEGCPILPAQDYASLSKLVCGRTI